MDRGLLKFFVAVHNRTDKSRAKLSYDSRMACYQYPISQLEDT